jgi:hypothetical protein
MKSLSVDIKEKECHERLYRVCNHELADLKDSAIWLTKGNMKPRNEGAYCFLQDRNIFFGERVQCLDSEAANKTVDHSVTKCNRMFNTQEGTMKFLSASTYHYAINIFKRN